MEHDNLVDLQLRNCLNDLYTLRLFRNTKKDFGDYIEYSLTTNNSILKIKPFTARCLYRELSKQIQFDINENISIDEILRSYKETSEVYSQIKKSRLHLMDIETLYLFLRCNLINDLPFPDDNKKIQKIVKILNRYEYVVDIAILLLMILDILPTYTSRHGDIKNINGDFSRLFHFLDDFIKTEPTIQYLPALEIMKSGFSIPSHQNRLYLIYMARRVLETFGTIMNPIQKYNAYANVKQESKLLDITGSYWHETMEVNNTTTYWQFKRMATDDYCLFRYQFKIDKKEIHCCSYIALFMNDMGVITLYSASNSFAKSIVIHKKLTSHNEQAWYECRLDNEVAPTKIGLIKLLAGTSILDIRSISKLTDKEKINKLDIWMKEYKLVNNTNDEYTYMRATVAITPNDLFIKQEESENIDKMPLYYRIPKELNEGLKNVKLEDFIGILKMNNRIYIGIEPLLLYFDITDEEAIMNSQIEIVKRITL